VVAGTKGANPLATLQARGGQPLTTTTTTTTTMTMLMTTTTMLILMRMLGHCS